MAVSLWGNQSRVEKVEAAEMHTDPKSHPAPYMSSSLGEIFYQVLNSIVPVSVPMSDLN